MLNVRKIGHRYERTGEPISAVIKNIGNSPLEYDFNERILIVLIESDYIQNEFNFLNPADYPNFLKHVLLNSKRIKLKEAACR